mgnify:CR=1 FL=1
MNVYLVSILGILVLGTLLELLAGLVELRSLDPKLPAEFVGVYDPERYARAQEYTRASLASPTRMPQLKATPQRGQTLGVSFIGVSSPMFVRMPPRG